jgi:hypothetical protein
MTRTDLESHDVLFNITTICYREEQKRESWFVLFLRQRKKLSVAGLHRLEFSPCAPNPPLKM